MLVKFAFFLILGQPLINWFGIFAAIFMFASGAIPLINRRRETPLPYQWHPRLARIALAFAAVHVLLAVLLMF